MYSECAVSEHEAFKALPPKDTCAALPLKHLLPLCLASRNRKDLVRLWFRPCP